MHWIMPMNAYELSEVYLSSSWTVLSHLSGSLCTRRHVLFPFYSKAIGDVSEHRF